MKGRGNGRVKWGSCIQSTRGGGEFMWFRGPPQTFFGLNVIIWWLLVHFWVNNWLYIVFIFLHISLKYLSFPKFVIPKFSFTYFSFPNFQSHIYLNSQTFMQKCSFPNFHSHLFSHIFSVTNFHWNICHSQNFLSQIFIHIFFIPKFSCRNVHSQIFIHIFKFPNFHAEMFIPEMFIPKFFIPKFSFTFFNSHFHISYFHSQIFSFIYLPSKISTVLDHHSQRMEKKQRSKPFIISLLRLNSVQIYCVLLL